MPPLWRRLRLRRHDHALTGSATLRAGSGYRFSHIAGTIFENTNKPLRDWFRVIHLMLTSKKGVSALQVIATWASALTKPLGTCAIVSAPRCRTRISSKLMGIVEVDETYVGGKAKNRHKDKRGGGKGGIGSGKRPPLSAQSSARKTWSRASSAAPALATLKGFVRATVRDKVSLLCTDQWNGYRRARQDTRTPASTTASASTLSARSTRTRLKASGRSLSAALSAPSTRSAKYMPLYVAEFCFRYNNRENDDIFGEAMRGC